MSYKDDIQVHADEIAWAKYGKDFYDLTEEQQDKVYEEAQELYFDYLFSQADSMKEENNNESIHS
jgi:hypothetical protein